MADLAESLKRTRGGYDEECTWLRFLADAHAGTGGFQGKIRQPEAGYWGWAAEAYSSGSSVLRDVGAARDTYLDRYPREDEEKFKARCDVAHYPNYVGPLTNLKVSYVLRKDFTRSEIPEPVAEWREDVDGKATTFAEVRAEIIPRAAEAGWVPVLIDMDPIPEGVETMAQAQERGVGKPRLVVLHPSNILEWAVKDGAFVWVKIATTHVDHSDWLSDPVTVHRYTAWTADEAIVYEAIEKDGEVGDPRETGRFRHAFGRVPLTILRNGRATDGVRGEAMHGGVATEGRRLFNLISELDEHIRSQAFAILVLIGGQVQGGEVKLGTDNGLPLSPEAKNQHYYLAPPASVSETLETRIENTIREIYRQAGVEFTRPATAAAASGIARRYEFAQTDAQLVKFAKSIAEWELDVDDLVGTALGVEKDVRQAETIEPPKSFDIEDLASEIRTALDAIAVGIGATAKRLVRLRIVQSLLQRISPEDLEKVEQELEDLAASELQQAAALSANLGDDGDGDDEPPPDDETDGEADDVEDDQEPAPPSRRAA